MTSWSSSAVSSPNGIFLLSKRLGSRESFLEELLSTNRSDGSKNILDLNPDLDVRDWEESKIHARFYYVEKFQ